MYIYVKSKLGISYSSMLIDPFSVIARCHFNNIAMLGWHSAKVIDIDVELRPPAGKKL